MPDSLALLLAVPVLIVLVACVIAVHSAFRDAGVWDVPRPDLDELDQMYRDRLLDEQMAADNVVALYRVRKRLQPNVNRMNRVLARERWPWDADEDLT